MQLDSSTRALTEGVCRNCGVAFSRKKRGGGTRADSGQYCSRPCAYAYQAVHGRPSRWKSPDGPTSGRIGRHMPVVLAERSCSVCGTVFMPKSKAGHLCSDECRAESNRRKAKANMRAKVDVKPITHRCTECGCTYTVMRGVGSGRGKRAKYCSDTCQHKAVRRARYQSPAGKASKVGENQRRRARKRTQTVEHFLPTEIFERDGWRCQVCGKKVDQSLVAPHPMSASLDHIVPLAGGGTHERKNVQLAHFICNSRKSSTGVGQLRMFG